MTPHSVISSAASSQNAASAASSPSGTGDKSTLTPTRSVTPRVVLFSLMLAALFGYVIPIVDYRFTNTFIGAAHLPPGAIAVLLLMLLVINPLLKLVSHRLAFSRNETMTVYITCLFSALVPGRGGENFWVPNVVASFYYATRENRWMDFLQPYLKPWMTPALQEVNGKVVYNEAVVRGWYDTADQVPWGAWMVPMLAWSSLILALYFMLGCLGVMLRAQWGEREALSFPLLRLPLELTEDMDRPDKYGVISRFFRTPLMWIGFGIAVWIQGLNGLNFYFPDVPQVPLEIPTGPIFTEAPWNQMGGLQIKVWPLVLGVAYLLTSEISFSLWVFYLFHKFQLLLVYSAGIPPNVIPSPTWTRGISKGFVAYQQFGAYWVYVSLILWTGREHFKRVFMRAIGRAQAESSEREEALSYPVAFWGFTAAFAFIITWTCAAGIALPVALMLWITYLILAIGLTRIVVEAGLPFVHTGWSPLGPLTYLFGSGPNGWLAPASAVPAAFLSGAIMTELRGFLLPSFVQGLKLAHDRRIEQRRLFVLIFAAILVSMSVGLWNNVRLGYEYGGLTLQEWWARGPGAQAPGRNAREFVAGVKDMFWLNWISTGVGGLVTYLIILARSRFTWFPLHPVGYIMFTPFAITTMWFSIFLGWFAKVMITRFGGTATYRAVTPLFLGLILGEVSMMLLWLVVDAWQGRTGHQLMPG
jgi:hypothetical protein